MNTTLPTIAEAPRAIRDAATALEERQRDLRAARTARQEAEAGLREADRLDLLAAADARDRSESDPPRVNRERAQRALQGAERDAQVEEIRSSRAEEALERALSEHAAAWAAAARKAHAAADAKAAKLAGELRAVETKRAECRALMVWLEQLTRSGRPPHKFHAGPRVTDLPDGRNRGSQLPVDELLSALERYVSDSTVEAREAQEAERERQEAERERAAEEIRQLREQHRPVGL